MLEAGILINLYEDEKVVLVIRRHWLAFVQSILITFVLLLVFIIVFFVLDAKINPNPAGICLTPPLITNSLSKGLLVIFGSIYLLSVCAFFYISWLDYYMDIFLVTNKRILRIEQLVLFGQNISETSLQHIQDVSSRVSGMIYTILNVGTIFIETAGERANFTFNFIKNPGEVATQILEMQKEMWGEEGVKADMTMEREKEKIEKMNTGDPLRKKEEAEKSQTIETNVQEEEKRELNIFVKKIWDLRNKLIKKKEEPGVPADVIVEKKVSETQEQVTEPKKEVFLKQEYYSDGRKITSHGVIWQSEQEISEDILNTLNEMDR